MSVTVTINTNQITQLLTLLQTALQILTILLSSYHSNRVRYTEEFQ